MAQAVLLQQSLHFYPTLAWAMDVNLEMLRKPVTLPSGSVKHWYLRIGDLRSTEWIVYEFNEAGVRWSARGSSDEGLRAPECDIPLGQTERTHREIQDWCVSYGSAQGYTVIANNCQDFCVALAEFLRVDMRRMPWTQRASEIAMTVTTLGLNWLFWFVSEALLPYTAAHDKGRAVHMQDTMSGLPPSYAQL